MSRSTLVFPALLALLALPACVRYRPLVLDAPSTASRFPTLPGGALAFPEAVPLLVRQNPDLARLRAEAAAVNLSPGPEPLAFTTEVEDGEVTKTRIGTDVLSLLGIGPRRAQRALACALEHEAVLRHHARARDLVASLAEAYAVDRVLATLASPRPDFDPQAFERAGLASKATVAAAAGVFGEAEAEETVVRTMREDLRREIARLVGASPESRIEPVTVPADWPPLPAADGRALLYARGDLQRRMAAFQVADRRLRLAVVDQWPNLIVALGADLSLDVTSHMVEVRLPLGAPAEARAMTQAREVARLDYEAGLLDALHESASARLLLEGAEAEARGARARRGAAAALVAAARARMETEAEEAFDDLVLAAMEEVRSAIGWREAAVRAARERVRAARASGWPVPEEVVAR